MKINVLGIVWGHFDTLRNPETKKLDWKDIAIFIGAPVALGIAISAAGISFDTNAYAALLTFYGIFIGLLINIQVALFTIFLRRRPINGEGKEAQQARARLEMRRELLKEADTNIAYLTLISCAAALLSLCFQQYVLVFQLSVFLICAITSHFFLTLLMIVKRLHALFTREYDEVDGGAAA